MIPRPISLIPQKENVHIDDHDLFVVKARDLGNGCISDEVMGDSELIVRKSRNQGFCALDVIAIERQRKTVSLA